MAGSIQLDRSLFGIDLLDADIQSSAVTIPKAYNSVAYPSYCHRQTHPERLATAAILHGLKPVDIRSARVLELGCGDGTNLIPMAFGLPEASFVGVDIAGVAVERGNEVVRGMALRNIRLVEGGIEGIGPEWGQFDYVIAHGLYSWVPAPVRTELMRVCRENLSPHGIAFVSYNVFPGGHATQMLREMMLFHTRSGEEPAWKMGQGREFLKMLAGAQEGVREPYRGLLGAMAQHSLGLRPEHLFHDELAEINQPFWFSEFMGVATRQGLKFVGEADLFETGLHGLPASTCELLQSIPDRLLREQYLDFVKCRRFRQTLLCHSNLDVLEQPSAEVMDPLFIASEAKPVGPLDLAQGVVVEFSCPSKGAFATDFPAGKVALSVLREVWPRSLAYSELLGRVTETLGRSGLGRLDGAAGTAVLREFLLQVCQAGMCELHAWDFGCATAVSEKPRVSPLVAWQLAHGRMLTSLRHLPLSLEDPAVQRLMVLMDGTRTRSEIEDELFGYLGSRGMLAGETGSEDDIRRRFSEELDRQVMRLVDAGVLVG